MKRLLYCSSYITLIAMHCNAKKQLRAFNVVWCVLALPFFSHETTTSVYFTQKQPHIISLTHPSLSRSLHIFSSLASHLLLLSTYYFLLRASCYARSFPASRLCFLAWAFLSCLCISGLHVYFTCMACILLPLPYTLPYCTCTLLIACFVAPCTYFIPYITSLLCTCTAYF